jgi:hypothetical protein
LPESIKGDFSVAKSGPVETGHAATTRADGAHHSSWLSRGQLLEVAVAKIVAGSVLLEGNGFTLRAPNPGNLQLGERLLLRVVNPDATPPQLKLISDAQLPATSLAGISTYLRSLLFRHEPLAPTKSLLMKLFSGASNSSAITGEAPSFDGLKNWFAEPQKIDASWVKGKLAESGLFAESKLPGVSNSSVESSDLKIALQALLKTGQGGDEHALKSAIEGIAATQIRALDGIVQGNHLHYSFLLPFFGGALIEGSISKENDIERSEQWMVYLNHDSSEMGRFRAEILMEKKSVTILFRSDKDWMIDLIHSSSDQLIQAVESIGLKLRHISVLSFDHLKSIPLLDEESHAIFDIKV